MTKGKSAKRKTYRYTNPESLAPNFNKVFGVVHDAPPKPKPAPSVAQWWIDSQPALKDKHE